MANIKSAIKRARQNQVRRKHNVSLRSRMRTYIKRAISLSSGSDRDSAQVACREAVSAIDSGASKGLIHKNRANRNKRRLSRLLKNMS